jgi:hypothetical protein
MIEEKFSRHFMVVHTFVSDEARAKYCTPPENAIHKRSGYQSISGQFKPRENMPNACKLGWEMMISSTVIG